MSTHTVSSRRRFFVKAGAALSVPLAVGPADARTAGDPASADYRAVDAVTSIRELQRDLAREINAGAPDRAAGRFLDPTMTQTLAGVRRLAAADFGEHDLIEIAPDGASARAQFRCDVETETAIDVDGTLAEMARQQGEGFVRRRETRILDARYVLRNGLWKIERLHWGQSPS
jgi:hypothetical protein